MPIDSHYKPISVPTQDLYNLIFERKDRPFPDDHGMSPQKGCILYCFWADLARPVVLIDANTKRELSFGQIRDQSKRFGLGLKGLWEWKRGDVLGLFRCVSRRSSPSHH